MECLTGIGQFGVVDGHDRLGSCFCIVEHHVSSRTLLGCCAQNYQELSQILRFKAELVYDEITKWSQQNVNNQFYESTLKAI